MNIPNTSISLPLVFLILVSSCTTSKPEKISYQAPLFDNLGTYSLSISTNSEDAQAFFNQGLNLTYGFNHPEAKRAFEEAERIDPNCAMCYWGHAYVLGPNYNAGMEEDVMEEAYHASQKALELSKTQKLEDWEVALIKAMAVRYPVSKTEDRSQFDEDYAEAMSKAYGQFAQLPDIGALYAESLMDLHPWDLYTHEGEAMPWTPEIVSTLERTLEIAPDHPGANHMYIHAVEASADPNIGTSSAEKLEALVPGSGHLVHMPSHIYIRTGEYHKGSLANERAILVDSLYIENCKAQSIYPLVYYPHNIHFLAACATLEGRGQTAIRAAYQVARNTNKDMVKMEGMEGFQHFLMIPYYVLIKFGQWDQVLDMPRPDTSMLYPLGTHYYARGRAFAGLGKIEEARASLEKLSAITAKPALEKIKIWDRNSVLDLLNIAQNVLEADILIAEKKYSAAFLLLKAAIQLEDALAYQEPPDWFFSVRHLLGDAYLKAGKYKLAEEVYTEDLKTFPNNGWALNGLIVALEGQQKFAASDEVRTLFEEAWQYADIELENSRIHPVAMNAYPIDKRAYFVYMQAGMEAKSIPLCGKGSL